MSRLRVFSGLLLSLVAFDLRVTNAAQTTEPRPLQFSAEVIAETDDTAVPGVRAYRPLPKDFDPEKATDAELKHYGLRAKPNKQKSPDDYAAWQKTVVDARTLITTQLIPTKFTHEPLRDLVITAHLANGSLAGQSSNWSGFVIVDPTNPFTQTDSLSATFAVPGVAPCISNQVGHVFASNWVGIDGGNAGSSTGSQDVLQIGTSSDDLCDQGIPGFPHGDYYAWIEWYPAVAQIIGGLHINAGDNVTVSVSNSLSGHTLFVRNFDTRESAKFAMAQASGVQFLGDTAEWVVERPMVAGVLPGLSPYCGTQWKNMAINFQAGPLGVRPSAPNTGTTSALTMIVPNSSPVVTLSVPALYPGPTDDSAAFTATIPPCQ